MIKYDRRHGWRGPIKNVTIENNDWEKALDAASPPPGIEAWSLAIVLNLDAQKASIGIAGGQKGTIPLSALKWARKPAPKARVGGPVKSPSNVLQVGDVILVSPLKDKKDIYNLEQVPAVRGALVAMDPHTGRVLALSGGWSFEASQFNRATQALRQPGSAIKPFIYLTAMEQGFSPATIVEDAPISISLGKNLGTYEPKNVTANYYGAVPMRIGLQKSLNMLTVRLAHEFVGMKPITKMIEKFGIMDDVPLQLAMVLGAGETTLLKMMRAYAVLANGGKSVEPTLIDRIQNRHGKTIFKADARYYMGCTNIAWDGQNPPLIKDNREQLADERSVYQVITMMEGAVQRAGSARRARSLKKVVAAKTGTTNDERDAWTIGFTPNLVVGVFMGFDIPRTMGNMEGGARVALPIFIDFMKGALKDMPDTPFKVPPGIKLVRMHEMTGRPAQPGDTGVIYEALKEDQELPELVIEEEYTPYDPYGNFQDRAAKWLSSPYQHSPAETGTGGLY